MTLKNGYYWGTGRRKTAVARIRLREGSGKFVINDRSVEDYFKLGKHREVIQEALKATKTQRTYDIWAKVHGGGISGQAGAILMGLGRALLVASPDHSDVLRQHKFLTRDSRMVERKKYGRKKARKSFQFSKR